MGFRTPSNIRPASRLLQASPSASHVRHRAPCLAQPCNFCAGIIFIAGAAKDASLLEFTGPIPGSTPPPFPISILHATFFSTKYLCFLSPPPASPIPCSLQEATRLIQCTSTKCCSPRAPAWSASALCPCCSSPSQCSCTQTAASLTVFLQHRVRLPSDLYILSPHSPMPHTLPS